MHFLLYSRCHTVNIFGRDHLVIGTKASHDIIYGFLDCKVKCLVSCLGSAIADVISIFYEQRNDAEKCWKVLLPSKQRLNCRCHWNRLQRGSPHSECAVNWDLAWTSNAVHPQVSVASRGGRNSHPTVNLCLVSDA